VNKSLVNDDPDIEMLVIVKQVPYSFMMLQSRVCNIFFLLSIRPGGLLWSHKLKSKNSAFQLDAGQDEGSLVGRGFASISLWTGLMVLHFLGMR
jgi:hypothetical protein